MQWCKSEQAFWQAFKQLDALGDGDAPHWETPVAGKAHVDLFGELIAPGQRFFRKQYGVRGATVELSGRVMEGVLLAVLGTHPWLARLCDRMIEDHRWSLLAALARADAIDDVMDAGSRAVTCADDCLDHAPGLH